MAEILFPGMTPGLVAVAQANLLIPPLAPGEHVVVLTIGGVASNGASITVGGTGI